MPGCRMLVPRGARRQTAQRKTRCLHRSRWESPLLQPPHPLSRQTTLSRRPSQWWPQPPLLQQPRQRQRQQGVLVLLVVVLLGLPATPLLMGPQAAGGACAAGAMQTGPLPASRHTANGGRRASLLPLQLLLVGQGLALPVLVLLLPVLEWCGTVASTATSPSLAQGVGVKTHRHGGRTRPFLAQHPELAQQRTTPRSLTLMQGTDIRHPCRLQVPRQRHQSRAPRCTRRAPPGPPFSPSVHPRACLPSGRA